MAVQRHCARKKTGRGGIAALPSLSNNGDYHTMIEVIYFGKSYHPHRS